MWTCACWEWGMGESKSPSRAPSPAPLRACPPPVTSLNLTPCRLDVQQSPTTVLFLPSLFPCFSPASRAVRTVSHHAGSCHCHCVLLLELGELRGCGPWRVFPYLVFSVPDGWTCRTTKGISDFTQEHECDWLKAVNTPRVSTGRQLV